MTPLYIDIDLNKGESCWLRAGHEPPILYSPDRGEFHELKGRGLPLGVEAEYRYREYPLAKMRPGTLMSLATDGIWEARNKDNEFFGKSRFKKVIENCARKSAGQIVDTVFDTL